MKYLLILIIGLGMPVYAKHWVCDATIKGPRTSSGYEMGRALSYPFSSSESSSRLAQSFADAVEADLSREWEVVYQYSDCTSKSSARDAKDYFNRLKAQTKRNENRLLIIDFN